MTAGPAVGGDRHPEDVACPGGRIRIVRDAEGARAAMRVVDQVWGAQAGIASAGLFVALARTGNYVVVAEDDSGVVATAAGFFHEPARRALHSHVAAVRPGHDGRGWGRALKTHQQNWALRRGATAITWTYDPLIARNAHFNLNTLGAHITGWSSDLYGPMTDHRNTGEPSDRVMVSWPISHGTAQRAPHPASLAGLPSVLRDDDGHPRTHPLAADQLACLVAVPDDIETLRATDPATAGEWRLALREQMGELLAAGWTVTAFARGLGYVLRKELS